jgi:hypothetical protein
MDIILYSVGIVFIGLAAMIACFCFGVFFTRLTINIISAFSIFKFIVHQSQQQKIKINKIKMFYEIFKKAVFLDKYFTEKWELNKSGKQWRGVGDWDR